MSPQRLVFVRMHFFFCRKVCSHRGVSKKRLSLRAWRMHDLFTCLYLCVYVCWAAGHARLRRVDNAIVGIWNPTFTKPIKGFSPEAWVGERGNKALASERYAC